MSTPRIAVVTGASRGIGRASAVALVAAGWHVALLGRNQTELQVTQSMCAPHNHTLVVPCDVADPTAVTTAFAQVESHYGRLDFLFNNAGIGAPAVPIDELPVDAWQAVVNTNLNGMFYCLQQAFRIMKHQQPQGGRIVNNGSISAHVPRPQSIAYTATKHAVTGLTKAASLDGRTHQIAVGQIDIGNAATDMAERMAQGIMQAHGAVVVEPLMDVTHVAEAVVAMANLPLSANVLFQTIMATNMPYVGRG
jgi:NAD(P)-dependent dehydrogenase (short-subunit alcohol dehydrogenase family)